MDHAAGRKRRRHSLKLAELFGLACASRLTLAVSRCVSHIEYLGSPRGDYLPAEVHLQGHRRIGLAELIGDLPPSAASFCQPSGNRLSEGVAVDPGIRASVRAAAGPASFTG
jgi:hypothetical protein